MDATVLELDYIPENIRFREPQIKAIYQNIRPAFRGTCPINMILQGPPCTGKTTTVHHIFRTIEKTYPHIIPVLVNCQIVRTEFRVFHKIYRTLLHQEPPLHGVSNQQLIEVLGKKFSKTDDIILICLDDANALVHNHVLENVLRTLLRLYEEYPGIKIGIIATVNTPDTSITNYLSKSVNSVFRPNHIIFPPYEKDEVRAIMHDRVRTGIWPGVISPSIMDQIVEETGKDCDLRVGVSLLKCSADLAESDNRTSITQKDVEASVRTVREMHLKTVTCMLKEDEQRMLGMIAALIRQNGDRMIVGDLYRETKKQVPVCYSKFRRCLTRYYNLGLIEMCRPGVWGNTREVLLQYPVDTVKDGWMHQR